jgi:signal transduction histidine kinase
MVNKLIQRVAPQSGNELMDKANKLLAYVLVIGILFSVCFGFMDLFMGFVWPALANLFMLSGFCLALWLLSVRKSLSAKIIMIIILNIVIAIHSLLFNPFNYLVIFYLPVLISLPAIFKGRELVYAAVLGLISLISMVVILYTDYRLPGAYNLSLEAIKIQWILNFSGAAVMSVVMMYFIIKVNENIHQTLLKQREIIKINNDKLQQTIKTRDKLFSLIAHDMKGPFQSMAASLEILNAADTSNEDKQMVISHLSKRAENTIIMLNNLLLWSQTQVDSIRFKPEIIAIDRLIESLAVNFKMQAEQKSMNINLNFRKGLTVYADKVMLESILRNLVSNAIKFTNSRGLVSLSIDQAGDRVLFQILDNGVGMDELVLEMLRNKQSYTSSGTSREQGHGLGLLLVQEFLKLHHSHLEIQSKKGEGSQFSFLIRKA